MVLSIFLDVLPHQKEVRTNSCQQLSFAYLFSCCDKRWHAKRMKKLLFSEN
ncbi:hypothetical protein M5005_Spy1713 [Streptococcus pyogenes MGAS5005]|nr:hypothetical protein M5005_Spy1713 [Streptococcus pyogenes MGAS5005]AFV38819.1 hypothetical protein A20_1759c [Streptococcus pyogenes A20]SDV85798.1 hypothetical protein ISR4_0618 [Streptococcus pyogenes]SDV92966.1 hypothetical protein ISR3_1348 [Streptococcus pyogenes]